MTGGTGDDIYVVDNSKDVVIENLNQGIDAVQSKLAWTLGNHLENLSHQYRVEEFRFSDGSTLLDSQVQNLVSSMATFASAADSGSTTLLAVQARNHMANEPLVTTSMM